MSDNFLNFKKISESETELYIYGDIRKKNWIEKWLDIQSESTDAFSLKDALASVDTPNLTVRINSYGGLVSEGLAIYSLLSEFKGNLKTVVDGYACSAASVIFMAGKERVVPEQGLLMIHNAWSWAEGDKNVMRKMAEDLEKITQPSVNIYVSKTGLSEEKIKQMMDEESWITSQEAYELGFSTTQTKNEAMQALEANFIHNLVMKNKELQNSVEEKANEIAQKLFSELKNDFESKNLQNNIEKQDAWASFFNTKK